MLFRALTVLPFIAVLASLLARPPAGHSVTHASPSPPAAAAGMPLPLDEVTTWGYQIERVDYPGAVTALVRSRYDLVVVEPTRTDWSSDTRYFNTRRMLRRLKASPAGDGQHRKLVLAYIDIGEAEDWRWYWKWSRGWACEPGEPRPRDWPRFIITCDPDGWAGNYPVAYWQDRWKDIVIYGVGGRLQPGRNYDSVLDEVIKDGFDGIYLDWVEAYEDRDVARAARRAGLDPAEEMIRFIREMRRYARSRVPGFLVVQQNAASLIDGHPELADVIDGIAQEAIWFDGDATDDWNDPDGHDYVNPRDLVTYYNRRLKRFQDAGLPVFNCEYALKYAATAYARSQRRGYVPYVTRRALSRLTTTPPPSLRGRRPAEGPSRRGETPLRE